ncbi:MAG: baseplate J/gp47 family protein [Bacteroidota bacterium]
MSENCFHNNSLRRDGTSQQQRTLNTLLPSYVSVDERSMKDLMAFVHAFAEEIQYYDVNDLKSGHWAEFFNITSEDWDSFSLEDYLIRLKIDQFTNPHLALFFGFLYMFKVVQDDINTITERHLNFYYKEVLQLKERPAETDRVAVIFELAKHVESHLLKAGTILKAGKDNTGVDAFYKLNEDTVINKAQIAEIKSQFTNIHNEWAGRPKFPKTDHRIYVSPVANSADGLGEEIVSEEMDWRFFGRPIFHKNEEDPSGLKVADRNQGQIGFAMASPILFLAEGQRKISLEITVDPLGPAIDYSKIATDRFTILLSGEEEWIPAEVITAQETETNSGIFLLECRLNVDKPSVVAYSEEVFNEHFSTTYPMIKVLLSNEDPTEDTAYNSLINVLIEQVRVSVEIEGETTDIPGVKNLIVQNDNGVLDASKPMSIFGGQPHLGSKFYVGSWEVFQKKLDYLTLKHQWVDLPADADGFEGYYTNYTPNNGRKNRSFKIEKDVLDKNDWVRITGFHYLFRNAEGNPVANGVPLPTSTERSKLHLNSEALRNIKRDADLAPFEDYEIVSSKGFIRFTLEGIDFGHKTFTKDYATQAILLAGESPPAGAGLPNTPYEPIIEDLSLYYKSSMTLDLKASKVQRRDAFFHLEPLGHYRVDTNKDANTLLPTITAEGSLFIGIEDLRPPQTLSVLIQVAEGSANPKKEKQMVNWHYLSEDQWLPFDQYTLLSDSTNGLLTSGIVTFDMQRNITKGNSRLHPDYYWLRASVVKDSDAVCDIIDIRTQAISASFADGGNDVKFLEKALPAATISKFLTADASVKKIEQPYASSHGKPPEKEGSFFTRVSERLRHKNRSINIWDYEHLVLEKFPKVYKAKCINHTRFNGTLSNYSETAPGHVTLVIVANVQNKNAVDPLRPLASLDQLSEIGTFLEKIKPPCAALHVKNPIYEEVQLDFQVKFHQDIDAGYYISKLQEELKFFLSPWASDCATDIIFGGRIHKSVLLNFVEERSYVDYATCFKMYHIVREDPTNNPTEDVDEAIALTSVSIIGSANTHVIQEIAASAEDQCQCEDNVIKSVEELTVVDKC